jgi:aerobic-type carbon monoxide dehydrogenase small subunit (CoxS/CutS family)
VSSIALKVNGQIRTLDQAAAGTTLQMALRDDLGLTGTKYGCGAGECGCCTVLLDGEPVRSCVTPVSSVIGKEVTTIEGLARTEGLHPLQQSWIDVQVPQCGYCQSGQIIASAALLNRNPRPTEDEVRKALDEHICRCGTYSRIVQAVLLAAERMLASAR